MPQGLDLKFSNLKTMKSSTKKTEKNLKGLKTEKSLKGLKIEKNLKGFLNEALSEASGKNQSKTLGSKP